MILRQVQTLLDTYGNRLRDGSITDEELKMLLRSDTFTKSNGYVNPNAAITETNHGQMDAIKNFVEAIGPDLSDDILHELTARMITLSEQGDKNTFMRNSTLEKAFLAYEMVRNKERAEDHFNLDRIKTEFQEENDIPNLKNNILNPLRKHFLYFCLSKKSGEFDNPELDKNIHRLVSHTAKLDASNKVTEEVLFNVLEDTLSLLNNHKDIDDYKNFANTIQGKPNLGLQILGGLMLAVAAAALVAGVVLLATGFGAIAGGVSFGVAGGFFAAGTATLIGGSVRTGLSKAMMEVADEVESDREAGFQML